MRPRRREELRICNHTGRCDGLQRRAGGGTSYYYLQPSYQAGVVPAALALRNEDLFGPVPLRVEPDISMDADAQSGMLIGLTETFPNGVRYSGSSRKAAPASHARCWPVSSLIPIRRPADRLGS